MFMTLLSVTVDAGALGHFTAFGSVPGSLANRSKVTRANLSVNTLLFYPLMWFSLIRPISGVLFKVVTQILLLLLHGLPPIPDSRAWSVNKGV